MMTCTVPAFVVLSRIELRLGKRGQRLVPAVGGRFAVITDAGEIVSHGRPLADVAFSLGCMSSWERIEETAPGRSPGIY